MASWIRRAPPTALWICLPPNWSAPRLLCGSGTAGGRGERETPRRPLSLHWSERVSGAGSACRARRLLVITGRRCEGGVRRACLPSAVRGGRCPTALSGPRPRAPARQGPAGSPSAHSEGPAASLPHAPLRWRSPSPGHRLIRALRGLRDSSNRGCPANGWGSRWQAPRLRASRGKWQMCVLLGGPIQRAWTDTWLCFTSSALQV